MAVAPPITSLNITNLLLSLTQAVCAFGKVLLYRDRECKTINYAIKTLKEDIFNPRSIDSLKREIHILRSLDHPDKKIHFEEFKKLFYLTNSEK